MAVDYLEAEADAGNGRGRKCRFVLYVMVVICSVSLFCICKIRFWSCKLILRQAKSKKQRRAAAKRQRKEEESRMYEEKKVPLYEQTVDLPTSDGTLEGAANAEAAQKELQRAMRKKRKADIKEANFLRTMR